MTKLHFVVVTIATLFATIQADEYIYYPSADMSYKFVADPASWNQARLNCRADDGYLVMPKTVTELKVVADIFKSKPSTIASRHPTIFSVGIHDFFEEGLYLTERENARIPSFLSWYPGQPDSQPGKESCMSMCVEGTLLDFPCEWKISYICEREGNNAETKKRIPEKGKTTAPLEWNNYNIVYLLWPKNLK